MTHQALWPTRWPLIAKQECVDVVNASPPDARSQVKWSLPCQDCEKSTACLNAKRKELGALLYDREIMTRPRSSESSLFPRELFEKHLRPEQSMVPIYQKVHGQEHRYAVASAYDVAWSERTGGDWMVKMTAVLDRVTGVRTMLDVWRGRKLSFPQQMDLIQLEHAKYNDDVVVIESDAAQQVWSQYLTSNTSVPVLPHSAASKHDLQTGVPSLIMQLEAGQWVFPFENGSFHHENMEVFLDEAESFGWKNDKLQGVGEHDDTVMCWFHLAWAMSFLVTGQPGQSTRTARRNAYI